MSVSLSLTCALLLENTPKKGEKGREGECILTAEAVTIIHGVDLPIGHGGVTDIRGALPHVDHSIPITIASRLWRE